MEKIFKGFYHTRIWAWRYLGQRTATILAIFRFPYLRKFHMKFWAKLAQRLQRSRLKMLTDARTNGRRTKSYHYSLSWAKLRWAKNYKVVRPWNVHALRKQAYSNIQKISSPKTENFQIKNSIFYNYNSAQNMDCGYSLEPPRRGGSNEYPQSMLLSRNKNKSCRRTASLPAGYILYCNIFII